MKKFWNWKNRTILNQETNLESDRKGAVPKWHNR